MTLLSVPKREQMWKLHYPNHGIWRFSYQRWWWEKFLVCVEISIQFYLMTRKLQIDTNFIPLSSFWTHGKFPLQLNVKHLYQKCWYLAKLLNYAKLWNFPHSKTVIKCYLFRNLWKNAQSWQLNAWRKLQMMKDLAGKLNVFWLLILFLKIYLGAKLLRIMSDNVKILGMT